MAYQMYMTVKGQKQGDFKGDSPRRGKDSILLVGYEWQVEAPRDPASGLPTGKRTHGPVVVVKEIDAASPMFLIAISQNENLLSVEIDFLSTAADGKETVDFQVRLTNASVVSLRDSVATADTGGPAVDTRRLERIAFTFQKIEETWLPGSTSAGDDWTVGV
jgi:type VI secretion system secreted protein Hcp